MRLIRFMPPFQFVFFFQKDLPTLRFLTSDLAGGSIIPSLLQIIPPSIVFSFNYSSFIFFSPSIIPSLPHFFSFNFLRPSSFFSLSIIPHFFSFDYLRPPSWLRIVSAQCKELPWSGLANRWLLRRHNLLSAMRMMIWRNTFSNFEK